MKKDNLTNQSGRSMIEMLGVIAVIGVISVGGFSMVEKMQTNYEDNKVMDELNNIAQKVRPVFRDYYAGEEKTNDDGTTENVDGDGDFGEYLKKAFAKSTITFTKDSSDAKSATTTGESGKEYTVTYVEATTGSGDSAGSAEYYTITAKYLSESSCMTIATSNWGNGVTVSVNGTEILNPAQAATDCGGESNEVILTFK